MILNIFDENRNCRFWFFGATLEVNIFSKITPTLDKRDLRKDIFQGSKIPLKYARIFQTEFWTVLKIDFRPLNMPETFFLWSQIVQGTSEDKFGHFSDFRDFGEKSTFWTCFAFLKWAKIFSKIDEKLKFLRVLALTRTWKVQTFQKVPQMKAMTQENIFDPPFACIGAHTWKLQPKRCEKSEILAFWTGGGTWVHFGGCFFQKRKIRSEGRFFGKISKIWKIVKFVLWSPLNIFKP